MGTPNRKEAFFLFYNPSVSSADSSLYTREPNGEASETRRVFSFPADGKKTGGSLVLRFLFPSAVVIGVRSLFSFPLFSSSGFPRILRTESFLPPAARRREGGSIFFFSAFSGQIFPLHYI